MNICMQKMIYYKGYMIDKRKVYLIRNNAGYVISSQPTLMLAKQWIDNELNKENK